MDEHKRIVEIGGVKLEVDLRQAKAVTAYRVGDPVKVLVKEYAGYKSYPGVIVGFDEFEKLPTIVVAYLKIEYSSAELRFAYYNDSEESKTLEICPAAAEDLPIEKSRVLEMMDREIAKQEQVCQELKAKKAYFVRCFGQYFKLEPAEL